LVDFWEAFGLHFEVLGSFWAPGDAKGSPKGAQGAPGKAKREPRDVIFRKSGLIGNVCFLLVLIGSGAHGRGRRAPKGDQEELGCHLWGGSASKKGAQSETKYRFLVVVVFCVFFVFVCFFIVFSEKV
jgi:hypothetical protein